ncbi:ferritin-like domain-containing protein [Pedobacter xixiisoli]|uniref:DUF2383 domain-containing protein n=1 Tax=Pedobacter xixiisoli TaxID=1476464 RepID=A0A285ZSL9_9SPHI|nr:PA2169 family four-helix-bundle protein [Pedobacter xixiisoli]SOD12642.1 conserved hypothetical protein [Pedobacter xixiisoli]
MTTKIHLLNELIELNNDRAAGFHKAIKNIDDEMDNGDLKVLFEEFALQSDKFAEELTLIVAANEGEPETGNSVTGSLHRAWIDVKSLFGGTDRESILSEAERGEDIIKNAYHSVIQQNRLSGIAHDTVSAQSVQLDKSHDKIKELRNLAR